MIEITETNNWDDVQWELCKAAEIGDLPAVSTLTTELVNAGRLHFLEDSLLVASASGHLDVVKYLVEAGAPAEDSLSVASCDGHLDVVKYLVAEAEVPVKGSLYAASRNGHLDVVKYLVEAGAPVEDSLSVASAYGHLEVVEYLLGVGADPSTCHDLESVDPECAILLIEAGAEYPPEDGFDDKDFDTFARRFAGSDLPVSQFGKCWRTDEIRDGIRTGIVQSEEDVRQLLAARNRTFKPF